MTYYIPDLCGQIIHRLGLAGDPDDMFLTIGWVSTGTVADLADVANDAHAAFATFWTARGSDQYTLKSTKATWHEFAVDPLSEAEKISSTVGGSSSSVIPQNTAYLIHKNTGLGGVYNKGRNYIPGCFEALVSSTGVVDASHQTTYNTSLATLLSTYNAGTEIDKMVLLHNPRAADPTPAATPILTLTLDSVVSTQRRRLRR